MKKMLQTYGSLCTDYYDLHKPVLPEEEWNFYVHYARQAQGPLLEPMCGSGHFLIPLLKEGFAIEGFDASQPMLTRLLGRATVERMQPNVWLGFLEDLAIKNRYALAFIPVGSFNLLSDQAAVEKSLRGLYESLLPSGKLVLELMTPAIVEKLVFNDWLEDCYERADGMLLIVRTFYESMKNNTISVARQYALCDNENTLQQVDVEQYSLRFYEQQEITALLQEAGFSKVIAVKAFEQGTVPGEHDAVVVYECTK